VPAAAVIPAPIAYIKVVAVKKLVVGFLLCASEGSGLWESFMVFTSFLTYKTKLVPGVKAWSIIYCEKIKAFKAGFMQLNVSAWNNNLSHRLILLVYKMKECLIGSVGDIRTWKSEVKFLDFPKTNYCESIYQGCFH
jgi:hypothetical protein